jgi:FkbM family methyltransferase
LRTGIVRLRVTDAAERALAMQAAGLIDQIREHTIIGRELGSDSTVVDLGMNDGRFAREIHRKYGCRVIGVEPNPRLAAAFPPSDAIICRNLAISPAAGRVRFAIAEDDEASHVVAGGVTAAGGTVVEVSSVPLRAFLADNGVARVDLLKIDIEGAELPLFEGDDFDALTEIRQISVEFHAFLDPAQRPRVKRTIARMRRNGFYCIDFSATWKDVLFVNQAAAGLSLRDKIALSSRKYGVGIPAFLRKIRAEGLRTVSRKVFARRYARVRRQQT